MKLISPLVSRIAQRIFLSESICWMRAWAAISSTEMRSRRRLSSIGLPSSTRTTGLPRAREPPGDPRGRDDHERKRPDREHGAGYRVVLLGDALLHEVGDHHQDQQVERLHLRQLAAAEQAHDHHHEEKDDG
jgi:hypothetical protein